jgi:hypothetical protein
VNQGGKPRGGRFQPGQSGNPGGRPKIREELRDMKRLNQERFLLIVTEFLSKTKNELRRAVNDPDSSALEMMLASLMEKAIERGDPTRVNFLLDRTIGKVPDKIEAIAHIHQNVAHLSNEELFNEVKQIIDIGHQPLLEKETE